MHRSPFSNAKWNRLRAKRYLLRVWRVPRVARAAAIATSRAAAAVTWIRPRAQRGVCGRDAAHAQADMDVRFARPT